MIKITCVVNDVAPLNAGLQSEHGISFWIETPQGIVLFDTAQTAPVLLHNLEQLGLRLQDVSAMALSHAHNDHTGGLGAVLSEKAGLPIYVLPDIFRPRYSFHDGEYKAVGMTLSQKDLEQRAQLKISAAPQEIIPGLWTTGEITERPEAQGSSRHHFVPAEAGWQADAYRDDLSLVLETSQGLVVICGCCHAGLLNTLFHIERHFSGPIIAVLGGTHLLTTDAAGLEHIIAILQERYAPLDLYLNHCTGEHAIQTLWEAFGERVRHCLAGTVVEFKE
ncbi:MAG: MBL fold metallo-hydrolase [Anaerolineales bacterium]|nr:MBL fold metallo-hydrolase [Anaerolineales bacterium]